MNRDKLDKLHREVNELAKRIFKSNNDLEIEALSLIYENKTRKYHEALLDYIDKGDYDG